VGCNAYNYELAQKLPGHLLVGIIKEEGKKRVIDMKRAWRCLGTFSQI